MEMSLAYMEETADALVGHGFAIARERCSYDPEDAVVGHCFELTAPAIHLRLETVQHPESPERYFLEIVDYHGLRSHSFELDSWKHRPDRIEFKYQPRLDGSGGLAFTLQLTESC